MPSLVLVVIPVFFQRDMCKLIIRIRLRHQSNLPSLSSKDDIYTTVY